ncbi:MAG: SlyX family protein [Pseudomonadota bacterium]
MDKHLETLEARIAHLERQSDDLSDVVARQATEIDRLQRRVLLLIEQEADREMANGASVPLADKRPPHW